MLSYAPGTSTGTGTNRGNFDLGSYIFAGRRPATSSPFPHHLPSAYLNIPLCRVTLGTLPLLYSSLLYLFASTVLKAKPESNTQPVATPDAPVFWALAQCSAPPLCPKFLSISPISPSPRSRSNVQQEPVTTAYAPMLRFVFRTHCSTLLHSLYFPIAPSIWPENHALHHNLAGFWLRRASLAILTSPHLQGLQLTTSILPSLLFQLLRLIQLLHLARLLRLAQHV